MKGAAIYGENEPTRAAVENFGVRVRDTVGTAWVIASRSLVLASAFSSCLRSVYVTPTPPKLFGVGSVIGTYQRASGRPAVALARFRISGSPLVSNDRS